MEEFVTDSLSMIKDSVLAVSPISDSVATVAESGINGLDTVWVLLAAMLVFFMQPGFALVEAGFTRSKNTANILMKNFVDFMVGSFLYWMVGFGLMFGVGSAFFGEIHLLIFLSLVIKIYRQRHH